jgi:hypothetical protein
MTNRQLISLIAETLKTDPKNIAAGNKNNGKTVYFYRYDLEDYPNGKEVAKYETRYDRVVIY